MHVYVCCFLQCESKCSTTILTTCEKLDDLKRYGKSSWKIVLVENDRCTRGMKSENEEVLKFGSFNSSCNLEQLYISKRLNDIEQDSFYCLNNLRYLKVWGNMLKVIRHRAFSQFQKLDVLDIQENSVENIAHGFCKDSAIREINLSSNKLSNIQVDMLDSPVLERIALAHNQISFIAPNSFNEALLFLDLSHNSMETIDPSTFGNQKNLRALDYSHNKIKNLDANLAMESLEALDVSHNQIQELRAELFKDMANLQRLYLNNNNLKSFPPSLFSGLDLKVFHVHRNRLTGLYAPELTHLTEVSIGGNPWKCSCLLQILQFVNEHKIGQLKCDREFISDGKNPVCLIDKVSKCDGSDLTNDRDLSQFHDFVQNYMCDK